MMGLSLGAIQCPDLSPAAIYTVNGLRCWN